MKVQCSKLLLVSIIAGFFLLTACNAPTDQAQDSEEQQPAPSVPSGITNLIFDVSSPAVDQLYGTASPTLNYTITEGANNTPLPLSRLGASVFNTDASGAQVGLALIAKDVTNGAQLPALVDGGHKLQMVIRDQQGEPFFTLSIAYSTDITPPEVDLVSFVTNESTSILQYPINDPCYDTDSCDEVVQIFNSEEVQVVSNASNGDILPPLAEGEYTIIVTYTNSENETTTVKAKFNIELSSNNILVSDFITNQLTPLLTYTIDNPCFTTTPASCNETVEIFDSNGVVIVSAADNLRNGDTMPPLAEGQYTLEIRFADAVGKMTTVQTTFIIDTTSNSIAVRDILTNDPTPILSYNINESCFGTKSCQEIVTLDGTAIATRNGQALSPLKDSTPEFPEYTVAITYSDRAGNTSTESLKIIVDATPPVVAVIDPVDPPAQGTPDQRDTQFVPGGDTLSITGSSGNGTITFTSSENGSAAVAVDGFLVSPPSGANLVAGFPGWFKVVAGSNNTVSASSLAAGIHTVEVFAADSLGNQANAPLSFTFEVQDAGNPLVAIIKPNDGQILHPVTPTSSTYDVTYSFSVSDDVNQPQEITVSVTLEQWQSDANGGSWVAASSLVGSLDETMLTISGQEGIYEKTVAMPDGSYRLAFTAVDTALNQSTTANREFSVDTTAPVVVINNPIEGSVAVDGSGKATNSPILQFTAIEQSAISAVDVAVCTLLSGIWDCWPSNTANGGTLAGKNGNVLPNGEYSVSVSLTDAVGFVSVPDQIGFTVNAGASEITILEPAQSDPPQVITSGKTNVKIRESGFTQATLTVYFNGQQEGASIEKLVGFPEPNVELFNNVPLPNSGTYTLTVVATDKTGVNPTASASVTVLTDLSLPIAEISSPSSDDSNRHFMKTEPVPFTYNIYANAPYTVVEFKAWIKETGQQIALPSLSDTVQLDFSDIPGTRATRTIVLWAKNDNGGTSQVERIFFIDGAIPVVSDLLPTNGSVTTENPLLSYVIKDSTTGSTEPTRNEAVWLNGAPISQRSGDSLGSLNLVAGQAYTITVQAEDLAGNLSDKNSPSASTSFTIQAIDDDECKHKHRRKNRHKNHRHCENHPHDHHDHDNHHRDHHDHDDD